MPNGYGCDMALMALDGVFIFSNKGDVYYHAISENTGTLATASSELDITKLR